MAHVESKQTIAQVRRVRLRSRHDPLPRNRNDLSTAKYNTLGSDNNNNTNIRCRMLKTMSLQQPDPFLQQLAAAKCTSRARFRTECNTARQFIRVQVCKPTACSCHRMLLEHEGKFGLGMDAPVTVCAWNTNGIMVWAWMLWSPYALATQAELWFGHGCSGHRMRLEHERNYGLGMDALVTVCSWNTNGIMVSA